MSGRHGGWDQSWPSWLNASGGAPTERPRASAGPSVQTSAPAGWTPTARSVTSPIVMPASRARAWAAASCSSASHCSQHEEVDPVGELVGERRDLRRGRVEQLGRTTPRPRGARRARTRRRTGAAPGPRGGRTPAARARARPTGARRGAGRGRPAWRRTTPVGRAAPRRRRTGRRRSASTRARCGGRQGGELGHVGDPDVERVEVAARGRQVRRVLDRRHRLGGVQRVDQHELGAEAGAPPRPARPGRRSRRRPRSRASGRSRAGSSGPTPGPRAGRGRSSRSGASTSTPLAVSVAAAGAERCGSRREVVGQHEPGLADERAADRARLDVVVDLGGGVRRRRPRSRPRPSAGRRGARGPAPRPGWPARPTVTARQHPPPGRLVEVGQRGAHRLVGRRVDVERARARPAPSATGTGTWWPCQSQYSRETPYRSASSASAGQSSTVGHGESLGGAVTSMCRARAALAQLVEHRSCKADVVGSIPSRGSRSRVPESAPWTGLRHTRASSADLPHLELARRLGDGVLGGDQPQLALAGVEGLRSARRRPTRRCARGPARGSRWRAGGR